MMNENYEYFEISADEYRNEPTHEVEWSQSSIKIERMFNEKFGAMEICWYDMDNDIFRAKRKK